MSEPVNKLPIWERLSAIGGDVPTNAWNDVPTDLATNVDRYLYGTKKTEWCLDEDLRE